MACHSPGLRKESSDGSCSGWEEASRPHVWPCARNGWSKDGWAPGVSGEGLLSDHFLRGCKAGSFPISGHISFYITLTLGPVLPTGQVRGAEGLSD